MLLRRAGVLFCFMVAMVIVLLYIGIVYINQLVPPSQLRNLVEGGNLEEEKEVVSNIQYGVEIQRGEEVCRDCNKYCYTSPYCTKMAELPKKELHRIGCEKRLPKALIIGMKKAGTSTLRRFIGFHPQIASRGEEVDFFSNRYSKGIDWYLSHMPYALRNQTVIEKTPSYIKYPRAPDRISKDLGSDVRMIVVLRDPIVRAVSDFVHIRSIGNMQKMADNGLKPEDSFEDAVIDPDGNVKANIGLLGIGKYVQHLRRWYEKYPRDQILVLDGIELINSPHKVMKSVEDFLGLKPHFTEKHFYFDQEKHFYCLALPFKSCMIASKGRPHPELSEDVKDKLRNFFKPYDQELEELTGQKFSWVARD